MSDWVLSVAQLNEYVRRALAADPMLRGLRVRGEISGFKRYTSGHLYFSIKDETARVACVMFRQAAAGLPFEPADGMRVTITGTASLYPATGAFQLYADAIEKEGAGELYLRFEALKKKLAGEGLFDPALKKPLPLLPRRIGIVTSRTGAALYDMLRVIYRRMPRADVLFCHASVQGASAAPEIARALDRLNENATCDVILCGRGGGSIEDLWAFNEEMVARAIARSRIPVVSCVGHEVDFTIADFAADVRAATPSVAAELCAPTVSDFQGALDALGARMRRTLTARSDLNRAKLNRLAAALASPQRAVLGGRRQALGHLARRLHEAGRAKALVGGRQIALHNLARRLHEAGRAGVSARRGRLGPLARALSALDPSAVTLRGYALVYAGGHLVTRAAALHKNTQIEAVFGDGRAKAAVSEVTINGQGNQV